jgi:hypothetical protein
MPVSNLGRKRGRRKRSLWLPAGTEWQVLSGVRGATILEVAGLHSGPARTARGGLFMSGVSTKFTRLVLPSLLVFLLIPGLSAAQQATAQQAKKKSHKKPEPTKALPVLSAGPLSPLTLDQTPAVPPQVSYRDGHLTIVAQNSTLGDILRAVRKQTGASVEIPGNATERVVGRFGPGPARDVLASLLNGSHFNYVMLGSVNDPSKVEQVILTSKAPTGGAKSDASLQANVGANNPGQPNAYQPSQMGPGMQGPPPAEAPEASAGNDGDNSGADNADENSSGDQAEQQQENQQEGAPEGVQQPQNFDRQQQQQQVKTPEQLLQELQQQQLRQQQMQQGQPQPQIVNPVNQPPKQQ